jgi:hypothetical protein
MKAGKSKKKLGFDPDTGKLIILSKKDIQKSSQIVVDQIYETGFFALAS